MAPLFKVVKVVLLFGLIFILAVVFAPTLKGPFVVIHFSSALRGWIFAQLVLLACALAARRIAEGTNWVLFLHPLNCATRDDAYSAGFEPLRC